MPVYESTPQYAFGVQTASRTAAMWHQDTDTPILLGAFSGIERSGWHPKGLYEFPTDVNGPAGCWCNRKSCNKQTRGSQR